MISVLSALLGMTAVALHTMARGDRRLRQEITCNMSLAQLSLQFRRDAHRAVAVERVVANGDRAALLLTMPDDRTVEYQFGERASSGRFAEARSASIERCIGFAGARAVGEVGGPGSATIAALVITGPQGPLPGPLSSAPTAAALADVKTDRIEAAVGLDQRYLSQGRSEP